MAVRRFRRWSVLSFWVGASLFFTLFIATLLWLPIGGGLLNDGVDEDSDPVLVTIVRWGNCITLAYYLGCVTVGVRTGLALGRLSLAGDPAGTATHSWTTTASR
jgi:hypothetical protein